MESTGGAFVIREKAPQGSFHARAVPYVCLFGLRAGAGVLVRRACTACRAAENTQATLPVLQYTHL